MGVISRRLIEQYDQGSIVLIRINDELAVIVGKLERLNGSFGEVVELLNSAAQSSNIVVAGFSWGVLGPLSSAAENIDGLYLDAVNHQQRVSRSILLLDKVKESTVIFQTMDRIVESVPGGRQLNSDDNLMRFSVIGLSLIAIAGIVFFLVRNLRHMFRTTRNRRIP